MKYKFETRKPSKQYKKPNILLQFWEEDVDLRETEEREQEDGSTVEVVTAYWYDKYELPWREEFSQEAEYDDEGTLVKDSYINEHYDELLQEAKQL